MMQPEKTQPANHTVFSAGEPLGALKNAEHHTLHRESEIPHVVGDAALGLLHEEKSAPAAPRTIA